MNGTARSVRVIGQGDQERLAPLPEAFGQVFGFGLKDPPRGEFVFARAPGQQPVSSTPAWVKKLIICRCAYRTMRRFMQS